MKLSVLIETAIDDPFAELNEPQFNNDEDALVYLTKLLAIRRRIFEKNLAKLDYTGKSDTEIRHLERRAARAKAAWRSIQKQVALVTKQIEDERAKEVARTHAREGAVVRTPIHEIPTKLPKQIGMKPTFDNPYFYSQTSQYAGTANGFPFTPNLFEQYAALVQMLNDAGLPGFTQAYGSIHIEGRLKPSKHANFALYAANGKLLWRRHDPGTGMSSNTINVGSKKVRLSEVMAMTRQERLELMKTLFPGEVK